MKPFTGYFKMCGTNDIHPMLIWKVTKDRVESPDGGWNPRDSVYFTKAQARKHKCKCVSCRAGTKESIHARNYG